MRARPSAAALAAAVVVLPIVARAERSDRCIAASELGQKQRDQGALIAARGSFRTCAADDCPAMIRKDCGRWLDNVEQGLPTVVLGARDEHGADVLDVQISIDGVPFADAESGRAIALDPGPHVIHFEKPPAAPVEQTVLLRMGDHNRPILATFAPPAPAEKPPPAKPPPPRISPLVYVLGGVGVVGLGSFIYFGATGLDEKARLRTTCAPSCSDDQVAPVRNRYIAADVSLGVSLVAFAIAGYLVFHPSPAPNVSVSVAPTPGGAAFSVFRAF
jgi:hypothetical protein